METTSANEPVSDTNPEMHTRRIDMGDGRYLVFFTFGEEPEVDRSEEENV